MLRILLPLACAALGVLCLPTAIWLAQSWAGNPYYTHGPLVVATSTYLAWVVWRAKPASSPPVLHHQWTGVAVAVLAVSVHLFSIAWRAYWISALLCPLLLFCILVVFRGVGTAWRYAFPLAFLALAVPVPLVERFGPPLETLATAASVALAQGLGVAVSNTGAQVMLPGNSGSFIVGVPCGGLRSLIALIALACALAYILAGSRPARLSLVFLAVPIALAANIARLALLFVVANAFGAPAGLSYFHDWSSPALFVLALLGLIGVSRLMKCRDIAWGRVLP